MESWLDDKALGRTSWHNATKEDRSELKAQVARDLSEASGVSEQEAADFVRQWAHSSNDDDMRSLSIQQDAAKEFGLKTSDFTQSKADAILGEEFDKAVKLQQINTKMAYSNRETDTKWGKYWDTHHKGQSLDEALKSAPDVVKTRRAKFGPLMESDKQRAVLRSMYNETQAELKSRGIKEVRLYRGVGLDSAPGKIGDTVGISTNAIESWSVSVEAAIPFANQAREAGQIGSIFEAVVPAERVLSTPATGFGCLTEGEVVTLGGVGGDIAGIWGLRQ